MNINHDNIETYIIDYIDGELDEVTSEAVIKFINENPSYQAMLDDYKHTIMTLEPLPEQALFDKSILYKEEKPTVLVMRPKRQWQTAIAAALIIGLMIPILWPEHKVDNSNASIATAENTNNNILVEPKEHTPTPPNVSVGSPVNQHIPNATLQQVSVSIAANEPEKSKVNELPTRIVIDDISYIENQAIATINTALNQDIIAPSARVPELIQHKSSNTIGEYFTINIPFEELKEESIALIDKLNKAKEIINNTVIIAKIGNKEIKLK